MDDADDDDTIKLNDEDDIIYIFEDTSSEESLYAPIFGKWKFHTRIPILRRLWERQVYLNTEDDGDYLFDEAVETDYPLRHFLSKTLRWNWS